MSIFETKLTPIAVAEDLLKKKLFFSLVLTGIKHLVLCRLLQFYFVVYLKFSNETSSLCVFQNCCKFKMIKICRVKKLKK